MAITNNIEYINACLEGFNVSENDIDIILLKAGLNGQDPIDTTACDNAIYNRLSVILKSASHNIGEGGYSISWNFEAVKLYYAALCNELNKPNVLTSKIRNKSNLW